LCVQTWLGYGDVLFLGIGEIPMPLSADGSHAYPPYEIQTVHAEWSVERDGRIVGGNAPREEIDEAIKSLVGLKVVGWDGTELPQRLSIMLAGETRFRISGCDEGTAMTSEAWSIRRPNGEYVVVKCDGSVNIANDNAPA